MQTALHRRTPSEFEEVDLATRPVTPVPPSDLGDVEQGQAIATLPHRRRIWPFIVAAVVAGVLLALGLIGYYMYPRNVNVALQNDTRVYNVSVQTQQLALQVDRSMLVFNPNIYAVHVNSVNATLLRNNTPVGTSNITNIDFAPKSNTTISFTIDVTIPYAMMPDIMRICGVLPGTSASPLSATYVVDMDVKALSFNLVLPEMSGGVALPCPPSIQSTLSSIAPQLPPPIAHLVDSLL